MVAGFMAGVGALAAEGVAISAAGPGHLIEVAMWNL